MNAKRPTRLYRDPERGLIGGVFAGLSDFFGIRLCVMRLIGILMFLCATLFTVVSYVLAMLILPVKRGVGFEGAGERRRRHAERRASRRDNGRHAGGRKRPGGAQASSKLRDLEQRLRDLETEITSREFDWDRRFNES